MAFITTQEFNDFISSKKEHEKYTTLRWRELPFGKVFHVDQRKLLKLKDDTCMILTLSDKKNNSYTVWAPKRLCDELVQDSGDLNVYIRSNGLQQSKIDPTRSYYAYDIVEV